MIDKLSLKSFSEILRLYLYLDFDGIENQLFNENHF